MYNRIDINRKDYRERYPELFQVFAGYFHEDAGCISEEEVSLDEYENIINEFIETEGTTERIRLIIKELEDFSEEIKHDTENEIYNIILQAFFARYIDNMLRYLNTDKPSDVLKDMKQRLEQALADKEQE